MYDPQHRSKAARIAREWMLSNPLFLDTETTGLDNRSEIVEIAIVGLDGSVLYNSLVKPVGSIPPDAYRIHRISAEMVADAPTWEEQWDDINKILNGRSVCIYNAEYDTRLMKQSHRLHGILWNKGFTDQCVMNLYAMYNGNWNSYRRSYNWVSLENVGKRLRIPLPNVHRALDDTLLTRAVMSKIAEG